MKVCILSDSHDNRELIHQGVADAVTKGAQCILHCGDVVAPSTLSVLFEFDLPIHVVHGNNNGDLYMMSKVSAKTNNKMHYYGQDADIEIAGKKVFLVHYPHYAQGMATTGKWDVVCCGHSHKAKIESIANIKGTETMLINPGTVGGVGNPATYILGDFDKMRFDIIEIRK